MTVTAGFAAAGPAAWPRPVSRWARRWSRWRARLRLQLGLPPCAAWLDYDRYPIPLMVTSLLEYHTRLLACQKEPETIEWIERTFAAGDVFYDIGANVGTYTLVAAACWAQAVRIVAIEPSPLNFVNLIRNLRLNACARHVVPLPVALARTTGMQPFHFHTLEPGGAQHALGDARDYRGQPFQPVASCPMLAFDLDTLIEQLALPAPTHLKLDVDGTELDILQGAARTLGGVRSLLVELDEHHPQTLPTRALLQEHGFAEVGAYPYRYGRTQPEFRGVANVIFSKPHAGGARP